MCVFSYSIIKYNNTSFEVFTDYDKVICKCIKDINGEVTLVNGEKKPSFYICIVTIEQLGFKNFYDKLAESDYRFKEITKDYLPKPIIFISAFNVFKDFHKEKSEKGYCTVSEVDFFKIQQDDYNKRIKHFKVDKRVGFLDNSIWHYYVPIQNYQFYKQEGKVISFKERLKHAINEIRKNFKNKVYNTAVAKENLEFQVRLMKNSYLTDIGDGHSKHITPFVFHSEGEMYHRSNYEISKICAYYELKNYSTQFNKKIEWNVLLLDDFANKSLKGTDKTKKDILKNIIDQIQKKSGESLKINIKFDKIKENDDCLSHYLENNNQYDIILLDYLLGSSEKKDIEHRQLGSELFTNPSYKEKLKQRKGVLGKKWFLSISSFNKAMLDKISNEGIGRVTEDWYLFDGADIISTPELFKYNLVKLIELQLNQAIVTKEKIIKEVFDDVDWDIEKVRPTARMQYGAYMHKFGLREFLKNDIENKSAFATSIMQLNDFKYHDDYLLYEDTRKLLYLLGFSTKYQKNELWETFTRVKNKVEENSSLTIISKYINEI